MDVSNLTYAAKVELFELLKAQEDYEKHNAILKAFPDEGPTARALYPKHIAFFAAGKEFKERALIGANRVGKTYDINYETACHLTGKYPSWWEGKIFTRPIKAWAAGFKNNIKEAIQFYLLGGLGDEVIGTGFIPKDCIERITRKPGVPDTAQDIYVKHYTNGVFDGISSITLKSYDEKLKAFSAATLDWVHLDEEPEDPEIYSECLTRTMTTGGNLVCSFTPLEGLSRVVLGFIPGGRFPAGGSGEVNGKYVSNVTWDDAPHLTAEAKTRLMTSYLPYEIEARTKGIPSLGAGAVYPILESDVTVKPFPIPMSWPRWYGFDPGWEKTAAIWFAFDPNSKKTYIYDEYYRGKAEAEIHAAAIRGRGKWMYGAGDYAGKRDDGTKILAFYNDSLGLRIVNADKAVEAGILEIWQALSQGELKIFSNLENILSEFRVYRKDKEGRIVKENDHAMDAMRYGYLKRHQLMGLEPDDDAEDDANVLRQGQNKTTGY